ncbi:SLC22A4_5 [Acanthosepion pharaonis]|uniref:SLC22A4_5 n=1 Tax=Acanthosepion pharaonis TaxID=158019 RepID=A0A812AMD5_ACAPH|nr:SLC22A4_5 [Sepia pharaonis]
MTAHFLGMTVGSLPSGWLADRFGRKTIIISGVVLQGISCLSLSQMQNIYAILSLRFLAAVADSGVVIPSAVFGAEISSKEGRKEAAIALHFSYAVGCLITSLFAYLIRNWSLLLLVLSIQSLPMVFIYIWFVPESPRWLLAMKKYKSAEKVFKKMAKMNKSDFIYNPEQEFPAYILCVLLLNRIGRKKLYSSFMIMGGITGSMVLLPALYAPKHLQWTVTVLAMLSRLCATGTFTVIFLYTCELYPTCIRNATLGAMSTIGRIGAAICPYVLRLPDLFPGKVGRSLPLVSMGAVCLISGILIQFLPETSNKALADDFEEAKTLHLVTRCETDKDLNASIPFKTQESKC